MNHYPYLIIGGGMTAASAARGIRELDQTGPIAIIAAEQHAPYDRPPLSKGLWTGKKDESDIWRNLPEAVTFHPGCTITSLDLENRQARDDQGETYQFDKLLLATGGTPRRLPFGGDNIIYYRTVDSYHRLRHLADKNDQFAVIGGGFIGSEIAAALAMNGKEVTLLFPEPAIGARLYPADLAEHLNDYYRQKGVKVLAGESVTGLEGEGTDLVLLTDNGRRIPANAVVAGIGIQPNVTLAEEAGLEVQDGIVVDDHLRAGHPGIYAAGDVANYPDALLDKRRRVEHEDQANTMGRAAGRNMAGAGEPYDHSPMYYSDLFDLGYEAVGQLDSRLETVNDWKEPFRKGVIYYLENNRVRGVLLWDVWGQVDEARRLIAKPGPFHPDALYGRI